MCSRAVRGVRSYWGKLLWKARAFPASSRLMRDRLLSSVLGMWLTAHLMLAIIFKSSLLAAGVCLRHTLSFAVIDIDVAVQSEFGNAEVLGYLVSGLGDEKGPRIV